MLQFVLQSFQEYLIILEIRKHFCVFFVIWADDDRAALYGAFLAVAGKLQGDERANALALWQRKGKRAFEAEQEARNN